LLLAGIPKSNNDAFDSTTLFGMLEVLMNRRGSAEPGDEKVRKLEGRILGQFRGGTKFHDNPTDWPENPAMPFEMAAATQTPSRQPNPENRLTGSSA
jgi:hypothetical protein